MSSISYDMLLPAIFFHVISYIFFHIIRNSCDMLQIPISTICSITLNEQVLIKTTKGLSGKIISMLNRLSSLYPVIYKYCHDYGWLAWSHKQQPCRPTTQGTSTNNSDFCSTLTSRGYAYSHAEKSFSACSSPSVIKVLHLAFIAHRGRCPLIIHLSLGML